MTARVARAFQVGVVAFGLCLAAVAAFAAQTPPKTPTACDALGGLKLAAVTITAATSVDAGTFRAPGANATAPAMNTPAFCRVAATLTPTPESHIKIEVWLPPTTAWNGKFLGTGNGGAGGVIGYPALASGLQKGYATTNTDMGTSTTGLDFSFGVLELPGDARRSGELHPAGEAANGQSRRARRVRQDRRSR